MIEKVIAVVERELSLPEKSMLTPSISHKVCIGRYICYRYMHEEHKWSANKLAKYFGRTRQNVFRGIMLLKNQMIYDRRMRQKYADIIDKIEGVAQ